MTKTKNRFNILKEYRQDIDINSNKFQDLISQIREEFGLSDLEIDQLIKFILSLPNDNNVPDVLEELIKCEYLTSRQKVAFSHMLGIFRTENFISNKKIMVIEISEFLK